MCMGGRPSAPINKPSYAPEHAYTDFKYSVEAAPEGARKEQSTQTKGRSVPTVNPKRQVRM